MQRRRHNAQIGGDLRALGVGRRAGGGGLRAGEVPTWPKPRLNGLRAVVESGASLLFRVLVALHRHVPTGVDLLDGILNCSLMVPPK